MSVEQDNSLYKVISARREGDNQPFSRLLYVGYLNEIVMQKEKFEVENYLAQLVKSVQGLNGYLYLKGLFYLHILESSDPSKINQLMKMVYEKSLRSPSLHHNLNIIYQSFQNTDCCFKSWFCENIFQTGPNLTDSDKTEQQIQERAFEIYAKICQGATKKQTDQGSKVANQCPLNLDDMCMMINSSFMSMEQFQDLYLGQLEVSADSEDQFPMRPGVLKYMEFLELDNCKDYQN